MISVLDQAAGQGWALYNADCVTFARGMPSSSVDLSVFSPPFSSLYVYSESVADMGNVADDAEFFEQYRFLARELSTATSAILFFSRLNVWHVPLLDNARSRVSVPYWLIKYPLKDFLRSSDHGALSGLQ